MAIESVVQQKRSGRGDSLSDQQKVNELEYLLYQIDAVATAMEPLVNGENGVHAPNGDAHSLAAAIQTLATRGLEITGAR